MSKNNCLVIIADYLLDHIHLIGQDYKNIHKIANEGISSRFYYLSNCILNDFYDIKTIQDKVIIIDDEMIEIENKDAQLIIIYFNFQEFDNKKLETINELINLKDFVVLISSTSGSFTEEEKIPLQSCEFLDGKKISFKNQQEAFVTQWRKNNNRRDKVTCYSKEQLFKNFGNGSLLSFHLISEISFILGCKGKYGS